MVSKKVVVIFVIIALIIAIFSVTYSMMNTGKRVSTQSPGTLEDTGEGKVGINILPPSVEDKSSEG